MTDVFNNATGALKDYLFEGVGDYETQEEQRSREYLEAAKESKRAPPQGPDQVPDLTEENGGWATHEQIYGSDPDKGWATSEDLYGDLGAPPSEDDVDKKLKWMYDIHFDETRTFGSGIADAIHIGEIGQYDTNEGRRRAFKEHYPEGEIRFTKVNDKNVILGRKTTKEPFTRINSLTLEVPSAIFNKEVGLSVAGSFVPGGPAIKAGAEILGAALGAYLDEQEMQIKEPERDKTAVGQAGFAGGLQTAASLVTRGGPIGHVIKQLFAEPAQTNLQRRAMEGWVEEGWTPPTNWQYSVNPLTDKSRKIREAIDIKGISEGSKTYADLYKSIKDKYVSGEDFSGMDPDVLRTIILKESAKIDETLNSLVKGDIAFKDAVAGLADRHDLYQALAREEARRLYGDARDVVAGVEFYLGDAIQGAEKIEKGVRVRMNPNRLASTDALTDPTMRARKLPKELAAVIAKFKLLKPTVSELTHGPDLYTSMDQMINLRQEAWQLTKSSDDQVAAAGNELYALLSDALHNPTAGDPTWLGKWQKANDFVAAHHDLEKIEILQDLANASPLDYEVLARKLSRPGEADNLVWLENYISNIDPNTWENFRSAFVSDLIRAPKNELKRVRRLKAALNKAEALGDARPDALGKLITDEQLDIIEESTRNLEYIEKLPAYKHMNAVNEENAFKAMKMVEEGNVEQLARQIEVSGGPDSAHARGLKAGLVSRWLEDASLPNPYGLAEDYKGEVVPPILNVKEFQFQVQKYKDSGKLDVLFGPEDWIWLENLDNYMKLLGPSPVGPDGKSSGAEFVAGEMASTLQRALPKGLKSIVSPTEWLGIAYNVAELPYGSKMTGWLMNADVRVGTKSVPAAAKAGGFELVRRFVKHAPNIAKNILSQDIQYQDGGPLIYQNDPMQDYETGDAARPFKETFNERLKKYSESQ